MPGNRRKKKMNETFFDDDVDGVGRVRVETGERRSVAIFLVALACLAFLLAALGCHSGKYYGSAADVAAANASAKIGFGGVAENAPAIVEQVASQGGWLNGLGAIALLGGCVCFMRREIDPGVSLGLIVGGVVLILAGFVLPLFAGWAALLVVGALALYFGPGLFAKVKGLFEKKTKAEAVS